MQDQVRYLTRSYDSLKGLKMVPFGLFMLVMAVRNLGWTGLGRQGDCTYTLPLLVLTIVLYIAIDRYYRRAFGEVKPLAGAQPAWIGLAVLGLLLLAIVLEVVLEVVLRTRFSFLALAFGAILALGGLHYKRLHYTVAGVLFILVNLIPLLFGAQSGGSFGFWFNAALGLTWIVLGLIDHFILVRSFQAISGGGDHA